MRAWLPDNSEGSVREALRIVMPEIADRPLEIRARPLRAAQRWWRTSARADDYIVKFAWSEPACAWIEREIAVHTALEEVAPTIRIPPLIRTSREPLILIRRYVEGIPAAWDVEATELPADQSNAMADEMAHALASFHDPSVLEGMAARVRLEEPFVQTNTDEARAKFDALVGSASYDLVNALCDWVDPILRTPGVPSLLHGDFHGFNLVFDPSLRSLKAVLDLEAVGVGDLHLDFRYLPRTDPSLRLLFRVLTTYEVHSGRAISLDRVMAWHILTSLGDTLWRTEAGIEIPGGGDADHNVHLLGMISERAGIQV